MFQTTTSLKLDVCGKLSELLHDNGECTIDDGRENKHPNGVALPGGNQCTSSASPCHVCELLPEVIDEGVRPRARDSEAVPH